MTIRIGGASGFWGDEATPRSGENRLAIDFSEGTARSQSARPRVIP